MSPATTARKIDDLLSKAQKSLKRKRYFEAERMAGEALLLARQERDYQRMATIIRPLQKARQARLALAVDIGRVTILNAPFTEGDEIEPGAYLIRPPMVGVDGRRFRLAAFAMDVPVAVLRGYYHLSINASRQERGVFLPCQREKQRIEDWDEIAILHEGLDRIIRP